MGDEVKDNPRLWPGKWQCGNRFL